MDCDANPSQGMGTDSRDRKPRHHKHARQQHRAIVCRRRCFSLKRVCCHWPVRLQRPSFTAVARIEIPAAADAMLVGVRVHALQHEGGDQHHTPTRAPHTNTRVRKARRDEHYISEREQMRGWRYPGGNLCTPTHARCAVLPTMATLLHLNWNL